MIPREVFERDRVLLQAERLRDFIDEVLSSRRVELKRSGRDVLVDRADALEASELVGLRKRLDAALVEAGYSGSRSRDRSLETQAYIPRNATLSQLQSLVANSLAYGAPLRPTSDFELPHTSPAGPSTDVEPVTAVTAEERLDDALGVARRLEA